MQNLLSGGMKAEVAVAKLVPMFLEIKFKGII